MDKTWVKDKNVLDKDFKSMRSTHYSWNNLMKIVTSSVLQQQANNEENIRSNDTNVS